MGILVAIVIGFFAGLLARCFMPGKDPGGFIVTTLLGIMGSVTANFIGHQVGWYRSDQSAGFFAAIMGAILLLYIYRMLVVRRVHHHR